MEENNKLFVFEKKEVFLLFLFVLVIAVSSFTLGVRIGKQLSLKADGYTQDEVERIDQNDLLKSVEEEKVDKIAAQAEAMIEDENAQEMTGQAQIEEKLEESLEALEDDFSELAKEKTIPSHEKMDVQGISNGASSDDQIYLDPKNLQGKYTIQLYSSKNIEDAKSFADPFIAQGHNIYINDIEIPGKGQWYRVSIGAYSTVAQAKAYLKDHQDFFQGKRYVILPFK